MHSVFSWLVLAICVSPTIVAAAKGGFGSGLLNVLLVVATLPAMIYGGNAFYGLVVWLVAVVHAATVCRDAARQDEVLAALGRKA